MKIRIGFVSNSSSSSYIIITTKETYNNVLKELSKFERGAVEAEFPIKYFDKQKVMGENKLVYCGVKSTEDIGSDWDFLPEGKEYGDKEWDEAYEGLSKFIELLNKEPDSFAHNYGC